MPRGLALLLEWRVQLPHVGQKDPYGVEETLCPSDKALSRLDGLRGTIALASKGSKLNFTAKVPG